MTFLFQKASGTSQPPAALQSIKNFQPQAFCNLETLDSSHLNLGHPKPGSRGLGKAGQKAASRVQHHLLCPVPPLSSLAPFPHEGTIRAESLRIPRWSSGV
jgi:hypothetical protein